MGKKDEKEGSSGTAYEPVNVMDNENYVKLKDPSVQGFSNGSKSIDDINVSCSHNVVEIYGVV